MKVSWLLDACSGVGRGAGMLGESNPRRDRVVTGDIGNDLLKGGGGVDVVSGDAGDDSLFGNGGDDVLDGGAGVDVADGGGGADQCVAEVVLRCE